MSTAIAGHGRSRSPVATVLETLMRNKERVADRAELVSQAPNGCTNVGADFADALIERIAAAAGMTLVA